MNAPTRIGDYAIERELGRGGMGRVYAGRHATLGRRVAIKVLLSDDLSFGRDDSLARFSREAEAVGRLRHPGVVVVHEGGWHQGRPFIVMDLVDGPSLSEELSRGPLAPERAARLVAQVARAVQHAHEQGILHRDLKPANVLLTSDGRPLLTDFGLAKEVSETRERLTRTGEILGTPAYMPPEQADGQIREIGPASDVYGLGALLYACLTGRPPFEGTSALNVVAAVLGRPPRPPRESCPDLAPALEAVCLQALSKQPEQRYSTAAAMADDLERWLEGKAVSARQRSLRPFVIALVAALGLVVGVALSPRLLEADEEPIPEQPSADPSTRTAQDVDSDLARKERERALAKLRRMLDEADVERAEGLLAEIPDPPAELRWEFHLLKISAGLRREDDVSASVEAIRALPAAPDSLKPQLSKVTRMARAQLVQHVRGAIGNNQRFRVNSEPLVSRLRLLHVLDPAALEDADLRTQLLAIANHDRSTPAARLAEALVEAYPTDLDLLRNLGEWGAEISGSAALAHCLSIYRRLVEVDTEHRARWEALLCCQLGAYLESASAPPTELADECATLSSRVLSRSDLGPLERARLLRSRACALRLQGLSLEALKAVDDALASDGRNPEALLTRMRVYLALERWEEATADAEALLALPQPRGGLDLYAMVTCWRLRELVPEGRERARAAVEKILSRRPDESATWLLRLAWLHLQAKRRDEAVAAIRQLDRGLPPGAHVPMHVQVQFNYPYIRDLDQELGPLAGELEKGSPGADEKLKKLLDRLEAIRNKLAPDRSFFP